MDPLSDEEVPIDASYILQLIAHFTHPVAVPANVPTDMLAQDHEAIQMLLEEDEEDESEEEIEIIEEPEIKRRKLNHQPIDYYYCQLNTREEFYFSREDEKKLILPSESLIIRNILGNAPSSIKDRLLYFAKFMKQGILYDDYQRILCVNVREELCRAYLREYRVRWAFRSLLCRWRIYVMNKRFKKEVDPITLSEPVQPVCVYDWTVKRKFEFEAKSISNLIESTLLYHEGGFAIPKYPRNPWTNLPFTYVQLLSIYHQLHSYGALGWCFHTLRQYNFSKSVWQMYHHSTITLSAIKSSIRLLESSDAKELLEDFIFSKMDELDIRSTTRTVHAFRVGMVNVPHHWFLEGCKQLAIQHFEAQHFNRNKAHLINPKFEELFKKLHLFLRELREKNLISQI